MLHKGVFEPAHPSPRFPALQASTYTGLKRMYRCFTEMLQVGPEAVSAGLSTGDGARSAPSASTRANRAVGSAGAPVAPA
ncbi:hypothetical protein Pen01_58600 [Phytomonospora endophytica]|nr:hypothetical protein Pen01_58600 [Phytomonospora endophytica]